MEVNENKINFKITSSSFSSLFDDDIESHILSPLSCLREFGTYWLLEFDLPLVNKKDIKVTFDKNSINIEAKLKEIFYKEKLGIKTHFQFFKKMISLPENINKNETIAKFEKGRLKITIPKKTSGQKIRIN